MNVVTSVGRLLGFHPVIKSITNKLLVGNNRGCPVAEFLSGYQAGYE
jgi:hypothetical protein